MSPAEVITTWDGQRVCIVAVPSNPAGARLLGPFVARAESLWPDEVAAEAILRDGLAFLGGFCRGGRVGPGDEAALMVAARNYLSGAA